VIYLIRTGSRWQIIKPGLVYYATANNEPLGAESDLYPPGDARTLTRPARIPAPSAPCPPSQATITLSPHSLSSTTVPNPGGPGNEPWLNIHSFALSRVSSRTFCFILALGSPPQPDSAYRLYVGPANQHAAADLYDVEIDGLGNPHTLLVGRGALSTPSVAPALPKAFLTGAQLEILTTAPPYAPADSFVAVAMSESIQSDEPLLSHRLDAQDSAPQRGCLTFPTGKIDTRGNCGEQPAG
jgi:hypothetical protein